MLLEQHPSIEGDETEIEITKCTNCHVTGIQGEIAEWLEDQQVVAEDAEPAAVPTEEASN